MRIDHSFDNEFFIGNRQRLRELFTGKAPIVITANGLLQTSGDANFPFVQDASFWYLTGVDEPDVVLVIDKDKEYLILPEQTDYQHAFIGTLNMTRLSEQSGITTLLDNQTGWKQLEGRLKKVKHVATLAANPAYIEVYGMYSNPARANLIERLKTINEHVELLDVRQHVARLRMVKQPIEIATLQHAIDLTVQTLKQVKTKLPKFRFEHEIEAAITGSFLKHGAEDAWKPIVASGANACTIHAQANNAALVSGELIVIDVGARVNHYDADITRTYILGGRANRRQQAIYRAVCEVYDFALGKLKPGIVIRDYEQQIEHFMGEKLRALGLIKTINRENVRHYFPHATSHYLGIDPHDAGDYERPLEPNVVLTVEPGIYIPEESIGVRIEDDILITETGNRVLSSRLSRELV